MKNRVALILAAALIAIFAIGAWVFARNNQSVATPSPQVKEKIKVGVSSTGALRNLPVIMGIKSGVFEEEGLEVEAVEITRGAAEALIAKEVDFSVTGLNPFMSASAQGSDLKWVGSVLNIEPYYIASRVEKDAIKKVAVQRIGGDDYFLMITALQLMGQNPDLVEFSVAGDQEAKFPMLIKKSVDAAGFAFIPAYTKVRGEFEKEGLKVISDSSTYPGAYYPIGVITRGDIITDRNAVTERFLKALKKSVEYSRTHKEEVLALLKEKYSYEDQDLEPVYNAYLAGTSDLKFTPDVTYVEAWLERVKKIGIQEIKIPENYDPNTFVDPSFASSVQ